MKSKSAVIVILPLWLASLCVLRAEIPLYLSNDANGLRYSIHDKVFTEQQMTNVVRRLAAFDTSAPLLLLCNTNVSVAQVAQTIGLIQQTGIRKLVLMVPATHGGTNGTFQITLDCTKYEFWEGLGCSGGCTSGFHASSERNSVWAWYLMQRTNPTTDDSQQGAAPLPRAPQAGHSEGAR